MAQTFEERLLALVREHLLERGGPVKGVPCQAVADAVSYLDDALRCLGTRDGDEEGIKLQGTT